MNRNPRNLPTIARGNPLFLTCAMTDPTTGDAATGLAVTAFIATTESATAAMDPALSISPVSETPASSGSYTAPFAGDDITTKLLGWDWQSVFAIFTCASNGFREGKEYLVIPGQSG
jgi:hypothetical protein